MAITRKRMSLTNRKNNSKEGSALRISMRGKERRREGGMETILREKTPIAQPFAERVGRTLLLSTHMHFRASLLSSQPTPPPFRFCAFAFVSPLRYLQVLHGQASFSLATNWSRLG